MNFKPGQLIVVNDGIDKDDDYMYNLIEECTDRNYTIASFFSKSGSWKNGEFPVARVHHDYELYSEAFVE